MGLQEKGTVARPGETLLVKPGERLAVDGVVTDYLGITSNGTALLVCGSDVWAVSLP